MSAGSELLLEEPIVEAVRSGRSPTLWERFDGARASDAGRGAMALFDQAVFSGTTFATSWIIKHQTSKEEFGLFFLAMNLVMLVRNIEEQLVAIPYRVYCHRDRPNELSQYTASVFVHQLCLSAIAMAVLPVWLVFATGLSWPAILCITVALPFMLSRESIRFITFSKAEIVAALTFDLSVCGVQIAILATLGRIHQLTVATAFIAISTSCAFGRLRLDSTATRQFSARAQAILGRLAAKLGAG